MKNKLIRLGLCGAVVILAACAQPVAPTQNITQWHEESDLRDFNADGRLAVKMNDKGSYANFDWTYQSSVQTINVNTPIGTTLGQLCQDSKGVLAVDSKGKTYQAKTAEELSGLLLGFSLPVQYLSVWAQGQWAKNAPHQILPDGRLQQFEWTVSRTLDGNGKVKVLLLENPKLTLRLAFSNMDWNSNPNAPKQCEARR